MCVLNYLTKSKFIFLIYGDFELICGAKLIIVFIFELTHGFGGLAMQAVLDVLTNCSDECLQAIDREYPMSNEIATSLGFQQTPTS